MTGSQPARKKVHTSARDAEVLRRLREKVERYELIFQATKDVVYELDLKDGSVEWNDALYTQYGYGRNEPNDTIEWWTGHVHPEDAFLLEGKIVALFSGETNSWQYDYRFRRADGGYNYVHDRGLLLRDQGGKPIRIIGSLLDMTEQRQLDIAKDEFVSLVSHQLRTPLTVIRVYGEMLTSGMFGDLSPEQAKWVRNMTNSSSRLIDVVGDILNVSRLDLGRIRIQAQPRDVAALIMGCIQDVKPLADEKQVSVRFTPPRARPSVAVDDTILMQIVHNLLTNAIRYTPPQTGQVRVSFREKSDGYELSVRDNGIGIPAEAQKHIYERFYRAKNALTVESQGSGLGLYLVKVMCDAFGGRISFESKSGKGTVFRVWLPKHGMSAPAPRTA
ncbi:MAG TPA: PAS domain-containing sensor histidine kinase [Candidatus Saccharimonadales bacterium]|nr:PAS domain-containing sensor histidine kinase [Candidatus Saccharimonadales bacterium]